MRFEALVASAFSLPALMSPSEDESWSPPRLTRPAISSCLSGAAPLNGMCDHLDLGLLGQRLAEHVHGRARPGGAVGVAECRVLLQAVHRFLQVAARRRRRRGPDEGHVDRDRNAGEVRVDVVGGAVGERGGHRGDREGDVVDQERVAVGRRARHLGGGDGAAGAGAVLHQHRLAHRLAHALPDQARDDVGGAAGRERHQDAHRLRGKACADGDAPAAARRTAGQTTAE